MKHARDDYASIQDNAAAAELANLVLSQGAVTSFGLRCRQLARQVLGIEDHGNIAGSIPIHTNGTVRLIPKDEPVFLIRGQDAVGGAAVRAWAALAEASGAKPDILAAAREHAHKMDAWPNKKTPDLPGAPT